MRKLTQTLFVSATVSCGRLERAESVLDFNVHASRARTTAEKLAATCLDIDPEQPLEGAHLVYEPPVFPVGLAFAKEVVTSLPYYSVPAPGQRKPYVGSIIVGWSEPTWWPMWSTPWK